MLVICEDCAKKYNIDESRIKGSRARFTCNECGHIIIVNKSDLSRPLVKSNHSHHSPSEVQLKDLDRSEENSTGKQEEQTESATAVKKNGLGITAYFLIAGCLTFIITNAGIGYIITQHYTKIAAQKMELHSDMLLTSVLVLLGAWAVSFAIFFGIGTYLSKAVSNLAGKIDKVNKGDNELELNVKGPRELTGIAQAISTMRKNTL